MPIFIACFVSSLSDFILSQLYIYVTMAMSELFIVKEQHKKISCPIYHDGQKLAE